MTLSKPQQLYVFAALALLMAFTRYHHFLPVPDASWAIYFIGGFYLKGASRWAFPALMLEAVVIDYVSTQQLGVSSYCLSPAYAFLVPTHAVLWFGGVWLRTRQRHELASLGLLAGSAFVAVSLAFLISNGSFYWLGGRYASPNFPEYLERFAMYYRHFLTVPLAYIGIAAVLHTLLASLRGETASNTSSS
ncbi:MAG: hypothetical protein V4650_14315 [Pseudomonadota bacterium]